MSQLVDEIRAILRDFRQSPWLDLRVRSADWQIFMAKPGGKPNPLLDATQAESAGEVDTAAATVPVSAPHLGLFTRSVEAGAQVAAGDSLGVLNVLDRATPVVAESAGVVQAVFFEDGDLVEYGEVLVALRP
jgi:biotin carboxyl carrier protein